MQYMMSDEGLQMVVLAVVWVLAGIVFAEVGMRRS